MKFFSKLVATFFGVGFFPFAPGTLASLVVVFLYRYFLHRLSLPIYAGVLVLLFLAGIATSSHYSSELKQKDPKKIVIDEACGQLLVLFNTPGSWFSVLIGFFLFRFFDIIKPFPVKKVESISRGWGIMVDDVVAGVYAAIILNIYLLFR